MRSMKEAEAMRVHGGVRDEQTRRTEDTPETAARQRLTLRHLHGLIETLREEHLKLEMRVDRLSELVERMAAPEADMRRESGYVGRTADSRRLVALPEVPLDAGSAFGGRLEEAGGRGTAKPNGAEDRAAFGFAIWAGVERAIGNAAVMLAAGQETGADDADRPADRPQAAAEPAALFRRRQAPEPGQHEVPIESLLLELREAARIADEIAVNASAAEHRASPAHPARAPDMSGGDGSGMPGGDAAGAGAPSPVHDPGASGGSPAGPFARDAAADAARQGQETAAAVNAVSQTPDAGNAAGGGEPAAANPTAAHSAAAHPSVDVPAEDPAAAADGPDRPDPRQPASDMPAIMIPRSERHRVRKKRSLWTRLFTRHHADL